MCPFIPPLSPPRKQGGEGRSPANPMRISPKWQSNRLPKGTPINLRCTVNPLNPPTPLTRVSPCASPDKGFPLIRGTKGVRGSSPLVFPLNPPDKGGLETAPLAIPPYHGGSEGFRGTFETSLGGATGERPLISIIHHKSVSVTRFLNISQHRYPRRFR